MKSLDKILVERIEDLCSKRNISINRLATISGIRQSTLQNIMSGNTNNPKIQTLNKIARGFGMTLSEFFDSDEINAMNKSTKV